MDTYTGECNLCHEEWGCIEGICSNCAASDCEICYEHWTDICNDKIKPEEDVWKEKEQ